MGGDSTAAMMFIRQSFEFPNFYIIVVVVVDSLALPVEIG